MDLGFTQQGWSFARTDAEIDGDGRALFDWHGLRARFLAARACQAALLGESQAPRSALGSAVTRPGASFDCKAARLVAAFGEGQPDVNPNALADGKSTQANDCAVTGKVVPVIEGNDD